MKRIVYSTSVCLALLLFLSQCGGTKKKDETSTADEPATTEELEEFVEREFEYPIPTSYEVTKLLQDAGANFVYTITNDPERVNEYVTQWQKASNLGVYGADLSYSSTYGRQQETLDFLNSSRQLIEDLNITSTFNQRMADRVEANIENNDSLIYIITESFYDTYNQLNRNGDEKSSLMVISGSVIEGLYITSELVISSDYDERLMEVLARQKDTTSKLVEILEKYADDENINKVLPKLRYISLIYSQIGDNGKITRGQFDDIYQGVSEMRSEIVGE